MSAKTPMLDAGRLHTATFVRHVEVHERLGSTNDRAVELARRADIELPALVVTQQQTAGRGRGRNTWWSADGALTFSLLVDAASTGVLPANWPQLSLATAVAVCDALAIELRHSNPQSEIRNPQSILGIKWPNDVFLDGGKVCGILIESPGGAAPAKDRIVIGIGINVNNSWRDAPHDAGPSGTALCDVTGQQHDLPAVLTGVLAAMASRIAQLRTRDTQLINEWQRLDLLCGQTVLVESDGRRIEGEYIEIAHDGALVVNTMFGRQQFYSGTVRAAS